MQSHFQKHAWVSRVCQAITGSSLESPFFFFFLWGRSVCNYAQLHCTALRTMGALTVKFQREMEGWGRGGGDQETE